MRTSRKLRAIALLLALCSIFTFVMTSCSKEEPDDGDKDDEKLEDPVYMKGHDQYLDFTSEINLDGAHYILASGDLDSYIDSGLKPSNQIKAEGAALSGFWENQVSQTSIRFTNVPKDISGFKALVMNVYSENNNGAGFTLCINCQYSNADQKNSYFKYAGIIDWTGWKQFIIPINELQNAYGADPTKVESIIWNASGWSNTPKADSKLYFDSMYFVVGMEYTYTVDIDTLGDYNYDHIIDTMVDVILGGVSLDKADENVKPQLESYIKQAKNASESMNATGDPWNYDMTT
ncbi:MAG: hypothetical protein IJY04_09050, partial [Clostridia bacterium]|nr:hypothetical protein [Clostridia bacterium]